MASTAVALCSLSSNCHAWTCTCPPSYVEVFVASVPALLLEQAIAQTRGVLNCAWLVASLVGISREIASPTTRRHNGSCGLHALHMVAMCSCLRTSSLPGLCGSWHGRRAQSEALLLPNLQGEAPGHSLGLRRFLFLTRSSLIFLLINTSSTPSTNDIYVWICRLLLFTDWDALRATRSIFGAKIIPIAPSDQASILKSLTVTLALCCSLLMCVQLRLDASID